MTEDKYNLMILNKALDELEKRLRDEDKFSYRAFMDLAEMYFVAGIPSKCWKLRHRAAVIARERKAEGKPVEIE